MTPAPLLRGASVDFSEAGADMTGTVTVTWQGGMRAVVTTSDNRVFVVHADKIGVPRKATFVRIDLGLAENVARSVLDGDFSPGSVTESMLILSAAVIHLRQGDAQ